MTELCTVHVSVEGRVQGVGYRMWTEVTARDMGLTGWVRNRRDGSVEMVLSGPTDIVAQMLRDGLGLFLKAIIPMPLQILGMRPQAFVFWHDSLHILPQQVRHIMI